MKHYLSEPQKCGKWAILLKNDEHLLKYQFYSYTTVK